MIDETTTGTGTVTTVSPERATMQLVTVPPAGPFGQGELLTYATPDGSFEALQLKLLQSLAWNAELTRQAVEQLAADVHALRTAWKV